MTTTQLNNRYKVIQVLGAGGFGETFLAEDAHMPSRRRCVIKQLKPIANDPQTYRMIQQRFEREAATLEILGEGSPQIPKLYAYFSENGQFYLVQEWIQGQTFTEIVKEQGSLSEKAVREILLSLLSVLDYVHSKGIIHRDIKPDNIILRAANNKPVLIDFGAVKETIRTVASAPGYPTQSLIIGTPGYMPSEQAVGRPVYATDIYSLGMTAIYLLTGKHPHELQSNPQTGEILWQNYAPTVSPKLASILNVAIKPHVSDRYTTASKMLSALDTTSTGHTPTAATRPTVALSQKTQPFSSQQNSRITPTSSTPGNWQKPTLIVSSLVVGGLIGAVAIANISRQPQPEVTSATSPVPKTTPEPTPTESPLAVAPIPRADTPVTQKRPTPKVESTPLPEIEPVTLDTPAPRVASAPLPEAEPEPSETPAPTTSSVPLPENEPQTAAVPIPPALTPAPNNQNQTPPSPPAPQNNPPRNNLAVTTTQSIPAFPTGTSRSTVEATLGKARDRRGLWRNTRAVTYNFVPNQIDLGYLFDRNSGALRQTEAAFAPSVDTKVMQTTIQGMLGGETTEEIKQGLQQVQQRQTDNFVFTLGSLKGQIVRQSCDMIYISIWDADLHDFVSPSQARQC